MTLSLADLYLGIGGVQPPAAWQRQSIDRFVIDSRQATPGSCFVALTGERTDGHLFIADALQRGAIAVLATHAPAGVAAKATRPGEPVATMPAHPPLIFLVEDSLAALQQAAAYWRGQQQATVVGITGSVGKTSTKELAAAVLRQRFPTLWNEGNLNNEIGLPLTLLRLEPAHVYAVLEMGFYVPGEIAQLCALARPRVGVVTNIGPMHLERAGSMEAIFQGKAELVQALPAGGLAILNWDDAQVRRMADLSPAPVFRYGLHPQADLWADEIASHGLNGIHFRLHHRSGGAVETLHLQLPLLGRHSVHTALAAAAVGLAAGMAWEEIVHGLRDVNAQLRIEVAPGYNHSTLIDDTYNANPASALAALNLLADMQGRRVAVFGDMLELGSYAEKGHRLVGRRAAEVVDVLVAVGELAAWLAAEAMAAGMAPAQVHHVATAAAAIALLQELIQPQDFVLIKGSHATGMERVTAALSRPAITA